MCVWCVCEYMLYVGEWVVCVVCMCSMICGMMYECGVKVVYICCVRCVCCVCGDCVCVLCVV